MREVKALLTVALLILGFQANAVPITIDFSLDTATTTFGSFTFDSSLDGTTLGYDDLDAFSITLWSGSTYDLAFVTGAGPWSDWHEMAFNTLTNSFDETPSMPNGIFAAINILDPAGTGFWIGEGCQGGPCVADYPGAPFQNFTSITVTRASAVSEPGTIALLALGVIGLSLARRQRR